MAHYVPKEKENFFKVAEIIFSVIPKNLRVKFKERWKDSFGSVWNDDEPSGQAFLNNLKLKPPKFLEESIKSGNTAKWDGTALSFAFRAFKHEGYHEELKVEEALDELRQRRNDSFAHLPDNILDETEYQTVVSNVKKQFQILGWKNDEICSIEKSELQNDYCLYLEERLVAEKKQNDELVRLLADYDKRITDNKQMITYVQQDQAHQRQDLNNLEERTKKLEKSNEQKAEEQKERLFKVPPEVDNFVGRVDTNKRLEKELRSGAHPMVILHGLPGCGKTALAIRLAHQLKDQFDNVIMVDAIDVESSAKMTEFEKLCTRLLSKLEFDLTKVTTDTDILSLVEGVLKNMKGQEKKTLLILENSEKIVPSLDKSETEEYKVNSVNRLLSAVTENAASCFQILCLSRYAFYENVFRNSINVELNPLDKEESCQLLKTFLPHINDEDSNLLIKKSSGFPLLLQLISKTLSSYMETNDKDYLLQKIRDLPLLNVSDKINGFLEAIIKSLSEQEIELMRILSIFPSSFSRSIVDELCKELGETEVPFEGIEAKGFVTKGSASGYSLHSLLRECFRGRENNADVDSIQVEHALLRVYVKYFVRISERSFEKDQSPKCVADFSGKIYAFEHLLSMIRQTNQEQLSNVKVKDPLNFVLLMRFLYDLVPKNEIQTLFGFFKKQADESNLDESNLDIIKACIEETTTDFEEVEGEAPKNKYANMIYKMRKLYYQLNINKTLNPESDDDLEKFVSLLEEEITVLKDGGTSPLHKKVMAYYYLKFLKLKGKFYGEMKKDKKKQEELLHQSLKIAVENFGISFVTVHCYERLAVNRKVSKDREAAKKYFDQAYEIAEKANFIGQAKLANYYFLWANFWLQSKSKEEKLKGEELWWQSFDLNLKNLAFVSFPSDFWEEGRKIFFKSFNKIFDMHKDICVEREIREKAEDLINKFREFYAQIEKVKVELSDKLWKDCYQLHRDIATRTALIKLESERKPFAEKAIHIKTEKRLAVEEKDLFFLNKIIESKKNDSEQQLLMEVTFLSEITDAIVEKGPEEVGQHVEKIQSLLKKMSVGNDEIKSDDFRKGGWVPMKLVFAILCCSSKSKLPTPLLPTKEILEYFEDMVVFTENMASKPGDLSTEKPYFVTKDLIEGKAKLFVNRNTPVKFWDLCKRIVNVFMNEDCKSRKSSDTLKKAFSKVKCLNCLLLQ